MDQRRTVARRPRSDPLQPNNNHARLLRRSKPAEIRISAGRIAISKDIPKRPMSMQVATNGLDTTQEGMTSTTIWTIRLNMAGLTAALAAGTFSTFRAADRTASGSVSYTHLEPTRQAEISY